MLLEWQLIFASSSELTFGASGMSAVSRKRN
jgi:hypothetical protein